MFPVTTVDPALDVRDEGYAPRNGQDNFNHSLCESPKSSFTFSEQVVENQLLTSADPGPEEYLGLPVSLQLVGRRYEDEKVC